ncbi:MAG TPA: DNA polymerase/3'-5' exonuclease PolX [Ramlibacter sp.]|uniref:DNA polymerase/3'-5' exonuclease PolX n=1 Tax=Ramlibacter sp. TaxID=1917967 RepID=UPI002C65DDC3|nr:DNA polymerase/3'-5' exonuclease PolX [Ramlibacter sp.]HVZ42853.1 DNA polymerase/3'-5' exonuclease PolX [Ramlibacter sp.]
MAFSNADAAAGFDEIADLLEVRGGHAFRARTYRNAARVLGGLGREVGDMLATGEPLEALPGIGADLAGKIAEIAATGTCELLAQLRREIDPGVRELLRLPAVGPRRAQLLYRELGVKSLEQLRMAAEDGRVRKLRGFSIALERRLLQAVKASLKRDRRHPLATVLPVAQALADELGRVPGVRRVLAAGSVRRMRETVGDLDLLVEAPPGTGVMEHFALSPQVTEVLARGSTRSSVLLAGGLQVDLRVVRPASFGSASLYFTGSKAHNIALRRLALDAGLKLNEYGLDRGKRRIAGATEESVYAALGLAYIEPELREDRGEIEAARSGRLPSLVRLADLRGDLHVRTRGSDGTQTLREMALAARRHGLAYVAIADRSKRPGMASGLDAERLARQIDEIDALGETLDGVTLLKGVEVDILEDGSLDMPDAILRRLDLVVGSVHQGFALSRAKQTARLQRAMDHPYFSILGHATGRLIGKRDPIDLDIEAVIHHAKARGSFIELDAQPLRLDIDDRACRIAKQEGVLVSIASDAHGPHDFDFLRLGIGQARRGWLEPADILNTRPIEEVRALLARTMGRFAPSSKEKTPWTASSSSAIRTPA